MPFLFCCKRGFSRLVGGPRRQHLKKERGCTDTHPSVIYTRVGSCRFYPTLAALRARQRGWLAPWSCGRSDPLRSQGRQRRGGKLEAGLGSLWEQGECKWQQDCLGAAGTHLYAGVPHVLGVPGNNRTTGASAVSTEEVGLSSSQHICFFCLGGRGGELGVENNHGVIAVSMRIL